MRSTKIFLGLAILFLFFATQTNSLSLNLASELDKVVIESAVALIQSETMNILGKNQETKSYRGKGCLVFTDSSQILTQLNNASLNL